MYQKIFDAVTRAVDAAYNRHPGSKPEWSELKACIAQEIVLLFDPAVPALRQVVKFLRVVEASGEIAELGTTQLLGRAMRVQAHKIRILMQSNLKVMEEIWSSDSLERS